MGWNADVKAAFYKVFPVAEIPQSSFFTFCLPEHVSQEEFPALAVRKPEELQTVITGEKLLYFLRDGIHVFS